MITQDTSHVGELRLRRFRVGELAGEATLEITRHTAECAACRTRLRGLEDEQRAFEREIPFDRFAGGVERARRVPRVRPRRAWTVGIAAFAAAAALLLVLRPVPTSEGPAGTNRSKGTAIDIVIRVGGAGATPRTVAAGSTEALRPGERIRVGHRLERSGHLAVVAIDERGEVTPVYPERGPALTVAAGREPTFLPQSIELTGSGRERLFAVVAERPLDVATIAEAARQAHATAGGDLTSADRLPLSGLVQSTWLFDKP